jgi:3'(2'), 5'-bisphosphate nucleotidase
MALVPIGDLGFQTILTSTIRKSFPSDYVLGEEHVSRLPASFVAAMRSFFHIAEDLIVACASNITAITSHIPRVWVIDPIDGTLSFAHKGQYAISVALLIDLENTVKSSGGPITPPSSRISRSKVRRSLPP